MAGVAISLSPIDPIKALFRSAVVNCVIVVSVTVMMMLITSNSKIMRQLVVTSASRAIGWLATAIMAAAYVGMGVTTVI